MYDHMDTTNKEQYGVFGKLPSHHMAVAIIVLIGKKSKKLILDIVHYHTVYVHTNIFSVFNESFQSFPYIW